MTRPAYTNWKVVVSFILFIVHIILFVLCSTLLALQMTQVQNSFWRLGFLVSFTYVLYRLFISAYFIWGHWNAYRVFKNTGAIWKKDDSSRIAKRLGSISLVNFVGMMVIVFYSIPSFGYVQHGWVCLVWGGTLAGLTTLLEVLAVPSNSKSPNSSSNKNQTLGRQGRDTNATLLSSQRPTSLSIPRWTQTTVLSERLLSDPK
jgi:hypothetical protein